MRAIPIVMPNYAQPSAMIRKTISHWAAHTTHPQNTRSQRINIYRWCVYQCPSSTCQRNSAHIVYYRWTNLYLRNTHIHRIVSLIVYIKLTKQIIFCQRHIVRARMDQQAPIDTASISIELLLSLCPILHLIPVVHAPV